MEAYEDLMEELERTGLLDRRLEFLPSPERMAERIAAGQGMVRPELCVLLAYAKRLLRDQILDSGLPDDPYLQATLREYFPLTINERFGEYVADHPLRRELIATMITNDVVNSMGLTFVQTMAAQTGASAPTRRPGHFSWRATSPTPGFAGTTSRRSTASSRAASRPSSWTALTTWSPSSPAGTCEIRPA